MNQCSNCRFFHESPPPKPPGWGHCRRNPPQVAIESGWDSDRRRVVTEADTHWPVVLNAEWCGEWRKR